MLRFLTRVFVRPYRRSRPPSKKVAIVIPLSTRAGFTPEEKISLRHLVHYLGRYDKYFIAPRGMPVAVEGFKVKYFSRKFFGSVAAHTNLLFAPLFYQAFADYKYIFFYHLDSLAFSDQLESWCELDLDYIGPPFINCTDSPWVDKERVGNGGFTLLKVETALRVLHNRYRQEPKSYWKDLLSRNARQVEPVIRCLGHLQGWFPFAKLASAPLRVWEGIQNPPPIRQHNDRFWSDQAKQHLPEFKIASLEDGLRFGFEVAPRTCFERNGGKLPFGCHAWARYDRKFWEPFLLAPFDQTASLENVCGKENGSGRPS